MKIVLVLLFIFVNHVVSSQTVDEMIQQTYYNRVLPLSITSKSDVLYSGIDNYVKLRFPDPVSKNLKYLLRTHNGFIVEYEDSAYLTVPKFTGRSFITVFMITGSYDTLLLGRKEFKVISIPIPIVKIGPVIIREQSNIDRNVFFKGDSLKVYFTDDIPMSDQWCKINYFNIGYQIGSNYMSINNDGALLSKNTLDFLKKLKSGQEIIIKVNSISSDIIIKNLPLVRFWIY